MIYCQAILPSAGLGNRLFPWARCLVYSKLHDVRMISPTWAQIKIGPMLRGESDYRLYHNLFVSRDGQIGRTRGLWLNLRSRRIPEPDPLTLTPEIVDGENAIVSFEGWSDYFKRINGWHQLIGAELRAIT